MSVVDYLKTHGKYIHDVAGRAFELVLEGANLRLKVNGDERLLQAYPVGLDVEGCVMDMLEEHGIDIRFCEECGKPMDEGFMADGGGFYSCEDCFNTAMDQLYGKGKWRCANEEGEYGGYYEHLDEDGNWQDTGIFWTQWY